MRFAIFIEPIALETFSGNHNTKKGEFEGDLAPSNHVIWYGFATISLFWAKSPTRRACHYVITGQNIIKNTRNQQFSMSTCGLKKSSWENSIGAWRKVPGHFFCKKHDQWGAGMDSPFNNFLTLLGGILSYSKLLSVKHWNIYALDQKNPPSSVIGNLCS